MGGIIVPDGGHKDAGADDAFHLRISEMTSAALRCPFQARPTFRTRPSILASQSASSFLLDSHRLPYFRPSAQAAKEACPLGCRCPPAPTGIVGSTPAPTRCTAAIPCRLPGIFAKWVIGPPKGRQRKMSHSLGRASGLKGMKILPQAFGAGKLMHSLPKNTIAGGRNARRPAFQEWRHRD